jgi:aspartyl-tRNA(Asn)/glutamyl-tRNA(Gln) amidotransferase subunit C
MVFGDTKSLLPTLNRRMFLFDGLHKLSEEMLAYSQKSKPGGQNVISEEQVRHVANLARLGLTDEEVERMGGQLGAILGSIDKIGELELGEVPPTENPLQMTNVLRQDEPRKELSREEALSPAPESADDLFSVPRID